MATFLWIFSRGLGAIRPGFACALTVLILAAAGAAGPASPATALASPTAFVTVRAEDPTPGNWVLTRDAASGISVMLPGQPTVKNTTVPAADGAKLPLRQYLVELDGGNRAVLFQVGDAAFRSFDPDKGMQGIAAEYPDGKVTTSRQLVVDGQPAADGRITATIEGTPAVFLVRVVSDKGYSVGIFTLGRVTEESALSLLHRQVVETLRLI